MSSVYLEEYKVLVENTAALSGRRQVMNNVFASLNILFLTAVGYLLVSTELTWLTCGEIIFVALASIPINWNWKSTLDRYAHVLRINFSYLAALERQFHEGLPPLLVAPGEDENQKIELTGLFSGERSTLLIGKKQERGFTFLEKSLVWYFIFLYAAIALITPILTFLHLYY